MVNLVFSQQDDSYLTPGGNARKPSTPTVGLVCTRSENRPVSPLTQTESIFGSRGRYQSSSNNEQRDQPPSLTAPSGNNLEMVCDYDRSVTKLYEMLESSQWKNACVRCNTHPEEVHTWVVRRDGNGNTRWKLLPLHAAIIFQAPLSLIEELLRQHPIAAAKRDDQGILPLHLAFRHKSEESIIEKLLHQYPSGVSIQDHRDRYPLDHGKDMLFSAKLMRLYAETFTKCQQNGTNGGSSDMEATATFDHRLSALKDAYETRIEELVKSYEQTNEATKLKAEDDARKARGIFSKEIDDLRDRLSKQMLNERNSTELEAQLQGLSSSLADATSEILELRKTVEEHNTQKDALIDEIRELLKDQTALHDRCNKQQEKLDQAQRLREQLLRTLLQKDDGKTIQASDDICQLSDNNIARTEKLLASLSKSRMKDSVDQSGPPATGGESRVSQPNASGASGWSPDPEEDHGDDISAITDHSFLQPFGDR